MLVSFFLMIIISTFLTVQGQLSPRFHVEDWLPWRNGLLFTFRSSFIVLLCVTKSRFAVLLKYILLFALFICSTHTKLFYQINMTTVLMYLKQNGV